MSTTRIKAFGNAPYYDDFFTVDGSGNTVETKNYHRILFRPGYSVQARELTQLQTSLQAQIDRHGQYAFKHGSRVVGGKVTLNTEYDFIKIESGFTHSVGGALNSDTYLSSLVGTTITGGNNSGTQIKAKVLKAVAATGSDPNTLYIKYIGKGGSSRNVATFAAGEEFSSDSTTTYYGKVGGGSGSGISTPTGKGAVANIEEGVYFISGTFVHVAAGTLILDKYTNTPSCTVGLSVSESVVDNSIDATLVDNAQGVPNSSAPGATRYQISTTLVKESLTNLNSADSNYITLLQVENGQLQVDKTDATNVTTELSKRLARRTFEESGNYAVKPFQLDIREHLDSGSNNGYLSSGSGGSATKIAVGIEPSTAYVQGFRNENIATKYVAIDKPRGANATNTDVGANLATPVGNYVVVDTVKGAPDVSNFDTINLHSATNQGGSVIGTARARALEFIGSEFRLHLFDINMSSGTFSDVASFQQTATNGVTFKANVVGTPTRVDIANNSLVFKLPYSTINTLFNGSTSSTEYTVKQRFTQSTVNASGNVTVSIQGSDNGHFTNINSATFIAVGTGDLQLVGSSGAPTFAASYGDNVTSMQINGTGAANGTAVMILADVEIDGGDRVQKGKTIQTVTGYSASLSNGAYPLGKADVYNIISIADATGTDVKERFTLDDGQRDNFYDISRLIQKPGTSPVSGNLTVSFNWYEHTAGDYFSVDSYPDAHYETIPTFNSSKGLVELRDCIDFRPRKADNADNFTGTNASVSGAPDPQHAMSMFIEYYMPRIDKLYVTKEGEFKTVTGVPSENPVAPEAPADAMGIYDLRLNPYVFDLQDINPKLIDNKRYTMRDIGALDKRLKNVEYYTSLSLLEQQAENTQLFSSVGGVISQRTKNGFLVDGFRGHNVGDTANPDYQVSIDKQNGFLRPKFDERNVNLIRASSSAGTVVKSGSLAHLPKTSTAHITQPYSSVAVNVNPYNVFTWSGKIKLSPESDEWKETDIRPDVVINDEGLYDQFLAMAEESGILGTVWNEWETNWSGIETDVSVTGNDLWAGGEENLFFRQRGRWGRRGGGRSTTTTAITTTQHQSRTGLTTSIAADTVEKELGSKVVEINFIPFMRSRRVFFKAELLKPNTKLYSYFNGADITAYTNGHSSHAYAEFSDQTGVKTFEGQTQWVTDALATDSNSGTLVTDSTGSIEGSFIIPRNDALKFKTGTRTFKLTDSPTNVTTDETTFAEAQFHAEGLIESIQKEIISTKVPSFVTTELNDERTLVDTEVIETVEWVDPLAQTILIDTEGGIFADSVQLFFKSKDASIPVRVSIRSVENGIPTQKIVPGADVVLPAASVNVSANASAATTFTFDHPVYLAQNQEYAIVIMAQTDAYECYVAEMGGFDLTTPANRITKQPYGGVFFTSQNASTWTPEQSRDLKFTLNRCVFSGSGGHIRMVHDDIPARRLPLNSMSSTSGSGVVTVFHKNHGMQNALSPVVIITGATAFNGLAANNLNGTHNISNVTHDTYQFTAGNSDTASATGSGGGSVIFATENRQLDLIRAIVSEIAVPGTSIRYFMTAYSEAEVARPEVEILPNKNIIFNSPNSIASTANSATKTFQLKAVFTTDKDTLTPIIDLNRTSLVTVQNIIDNVSSGNELSATGGNQLARYITKKVELAEEADKIDVFLNVNKPRAADVDFYWRVLEGGSTSDITTIAWTKAPGTNSTSTPSVIPINDNPSAFSEIQYLIDPPGSFGTMQFKIVLRSSNSATVPLVKDFRAIAST